MGKVKIILPVLFCLILTKISYGQSTYQKWLQTQKKEYNQFLSKQDSAFIGYLKKNWIKVKVDNGKQAFKFPKPRKPIIKTQKFKPTKAKKIPVLKKSERNLNKSNKKIKNTHFKGIVSKRKSALSGNINKSYFHQLNYYDSEIPVVYNNSLDVSLNNKISNKAIARYWDELSKKNYQISLKQALSLDRNDDLNGWGYAKLLYDIGDRITHGNRNESYLFTWFMLVKSGYQARVGYENNRIYLLISTRNRLYSTPYFYLHHPFGKFYVIILNHGEKEPKKPIYTYKGSYPGKLRKLNFGFNDLPRLGKKIGHKIIHFSYHGKKYAIAVKYNSNLIAFYHYYPHTNLSVYFNSSLSKVAKNSLLPELRKLIKNKSETQASNFILHFVQYATKYETDQQQFGWEKPFFPEESMYYPYSDCEDRAVLFSYLIQNLLGLKVIGLKYPDHVTTAVKFTVPMKGDYLIYKGQKYFICDPTYINASIGESMPQFRNVPAKIVYAN